MSQAELVLRMEHISKSFPGVQALTDVGFSVRPGTIHALVGENGAGKSTLMKILAGIIHRDSGAILLHGNGVDIDSPRKAQTLGISMIHQELALIPYLTVGQNIYLGREPRSGLKCFVDWKELYKRAREWLNRLELTIDTQSLVVDLPLAQQQMVEVAKALSLKASVIIMDEPTSALTDRETKTLFRIIRSLKVSGMTIIYISHRLEEVFEIADEVTVLRDGRFISSASIRDVRVKDVVRMMVGRELGEMYPKKATPTDRSILQVDGLSSTNGIHNISFKLQQGEILGLAGLIGAGRTELARALFGIDPILSGEVWIDGKKARIRSVQDAMHLGMGYVSEDRKEQGLFMSLNVRQNITIGVLERFSLLGFARFQQLENLARGFVQKLNIRTPGLRQKVGNLSGGNQQKVIISRWLTLNPRILILDEPTRGIDVGAKAEIHALIDTLASEGVGILMISSELPEILGISDRILVMRAGEITGEFTRREATQDAIMHCAAGGTVG
ncbi:MAG TPA: sugar ABC transporter ATP-binding protein [bacterium]|nr:sugar ABC transporter ATP-binding protein [bacterium]